jgi:hypothetical protein
VSASPKPGSSTLVLYESLRATFVSVGLFGGLAVVGAFLVNVGGAAAVLGWILAVFFGACVALALVGFAKRDSLTLTEDRFRITMASQQVEYRWDDVRGFYTLDRSTLGIRRTVIGVDFVPGKGGPLVNRGTRWADRLTAVAGTSSRVPSGDRGSLQWTYGLAPDDLVNVLERWRRAHATKAAGSRQELAGSDPVERDGGSP